MSVTTAHPHVLIIAGMHRSGTSLLASWLQQCGLYIGDELVPAGIGNPLGHFEDLRFLEFHDGILNENHLPTLVTDQVIRISDEQRRIALTIAADRSSLPQWGWKDPRTCLFLSFWKGVIPDVQAIFIFRHPIDVIDSFRRRALQKQAVTGEPLFAPADHSRPWQRLRQQIRLATYHLQSWERHNREVLHFVTAHPADSLVVQVSDLSAYSDQIVNYLIAEWGFDLKPAKFVEVYDPDLLQAHMNILVRNIALALLPSTIATYRHLLAYRAQTLNHIDQHPTGLVAHLH